MGLHGKHTMPSMTNTIQLSLAKGEEMEVERPDNKLFIGMLSRTCTEEEVRALISPFGAVEEVYMMKDKATGQSKGCAFVKFATKEGATAVIDNLHQKLTMPGATQPLIAKWADPPKPKAPGLGGAMGMMGAYGGMGMGAQMQHQQLMAQQAAVIQQQQLMLSQQGAHWGMQPQPDPYASLYGSSTGDPALQQLMAAQGMAANPYMNQQQQALLGLGMGQDWAGMAGLGGMGAMGMVGMGGGGAQQNKSGPPGCNLFIYHIPVSWGDAEVNQCFAPFGTILSATVFKDKMTQQSKGFGFISYDNPVSAQQAISAMNGMQVDGKRLKVELKKAKGPY